MATIALNTQKVSRSFQEISSITAVNKAAVLSIIFTVLFISYFVVPHVGIFATLFDSSVLFVILAPVAALMSAIVSLRRIHKTGNSKGATLSYVALGITSLYFIVALAVPMVLIGTYLLYSYVI